jgi:hypothetical protein
METLPLDVLCCVLAQFGTQTSLMRLRFVSRKWRRAVDRVENRCLPMALCTTRGGAICAQTIVALPPGPWVSVGCGVFACGTAPAEESYVRVVAGATVERLAPMSPPWCWGRGWVLEVEVTGEGQLHCFRGGGRVARTRVACEVMVRMQALEACSFAEDGSVWGCSMVDPPEVATVRRIDLRSGEMRVIASVPLSPDAMVVGVQLAPPRALLLQCRDAGGASWGVRKDLVTGEGTRFGDGGQKLHEDVALTFTRQLKLVYDFSRRQSVQLDAPAHTGEAKSVDTVADCLIAVAFERCVCVFGSSNGRLLWSCHLSVEQAVFCGAALLLVLSDSSALLVEWK